jgi:MbtH protein
MSLRTDKYKVVINHEEQYSIIPITKEISRGWREIGKTGTQTECLKYIEEVWTDMKPGDLDRLRRSITG